MTKRPHYPIVGIAVAEMQAVLQLAASVVAPKDDRVMSLRVLSDGDVRVTTGTQNGPLAGGGNEWVFRKSETGWTVIEESAWIS